ncbi:RHS repeat protein [Croceibacterium sp. LX-88]|uniref:RHS repeat protein n=3 Tax=Croceibacterium selenioxidans TaxID=2838833 RepID=A0ABS5W8X3_9SPHN|nr:RHS repeat-associated core domain-containing protein [Croceibacterium selenioxidans]MBT2135787.1 RHS repeat protein [Croceibacterium selenioxidans]
MGGGASRFIGARPHEDNWTIATCKWTSFQYLCPQEKPGSGIGGCGTVLPSNVYFSCASGYTPTVDGHCRADPPVEQPCICDADGRTNPTVGNPIVLSTGAKFLTARDYETADGDFRIGRHYRSFQVGRPIDGRALPRSLPRGLTGGWNFDFSYELQLGAFSGSPSSPKAKVAVLAPDGTGFGFVLQADGRWIPDPAFGAANASNSLKLELVGDLPANLSDIAKASSTWKLTDHDDNAWTLQTRIGPNGGSYNRAWPTAKVARDGYSWTFAYNADSSLGSITDSFGRTATFSWYQYFTSSLASPPAGSLPFPQAVASIALPDGTSLRYSYDPPPATKAPSNSVIKRLIKVERLSSAGVALDSVEYLYEDARFPTHITGIIDNRQVRTRTYAYDAQGRATLTATAGGADSYEVEYGQNGTSRTRRVTNALGKASVYTYSSFTGAGPADYRLTQVAGEASPSTPASTTLTAYGSNTFISSSTDAEGRTTSTLRDARGRPTSIVEGKGTVDERTAAITWHPTLNVPVSIVRPGLTEENTYNASGQLETVTLTDTTSHTAPYSTNGQVRKWTYGWNAVGRLMSINGPLAADAQGRDDITSYAYDTQGNLVTVTNALGHVTAFGDHDAAARPRTMTDPNGVITAYSYDELGRATAITVRDPATSALNTTTAIAYDAAGQVTQLTLPATAALFMDYDPAGRLTSMRTADGERWDYAYDAMGNVSHETVKHGDGSTSLSISRNFDELGRLIRETTGVGHTAQWGYDKVGNPVSSISPNGHATTTAFDALDRVVSTVAPDSGTTALTYDARDNPVSHTDPISVTTRFVYNGFGEVIQEVSPDRGTSIYWYDAAGRLIKSSDGRGQVIAYARDALGRVTTKTPQGRPASEKIQYYWDTGGLVPTYGIGRLGKVVDGSGPTLFRYDHRGNLLLKQQTLGTTIASKLAYVYDLADRVTQITYPSGRIVRYSYDGKGRVASVTTKETATVGPWVTVSNSYSYEPFGAVAEMKLGNGLSVANERDLAGLLASRRLYRTLDGSDLSNLSYGYDADGNIASIDDHLNPANSGLYGYDAMGRLTLAVTPAGGGDQSYAYTPGTNRLASMTDAAGTRSIGYDARGNTLTETRPRGVSVTTAYDGYGRLIEYNRSNAGAQSYVYNGLDDRVAMLSPTATRRFIYDADGRGLGEYGASASEVHAEFIWALPQAANDNTPFGGDDGVGGYAPLAVASPDASGALALTWVHGNHLGVPLVTTNAAGNPVALSDAYLLPGFPGQSRVLPDLYYNRYRDYDPVTGRYIQADPIGLGGGSNLYAYAGNNPVNQVDPDGLQLRRLLPLPGAVPVGPAPPYGPGADSNRNGVPDGKDITRRMQRNLERLRDFIEVCFDDDDPCQIQKEADELECNQWHIFGTRAGYTRSQGYAICMRTVITRFGECRSRGINPANITTPLFLPNGRRSGPDKNRIKP